MKRLRSTLEYLKGQGWMGEAGLGLLFGVVVGLPVYLTGPGSSLWGVPVSLVWGGGAGVGVFLLAASLRLIPTR
jgi:hypothetical protein